MLTPLRIAPLAVLLIAVVACSGAPAAPPPSSSSASAIPSGAPTGTPDFGSIEHPTGATDVVLRYEEGGGFMMPAFIATQAPIFTLYGDGTIIFRNPALEPPEPVGSAFLMGPFRTARMTEEQVQALLTSALGEAGLGVARPDYPNNLISDASTAVFTVNAGGLSKTVSIYALGLDIENVPDGPARAAFARLASRLGNIDEDGAVATAEYQPERYRGILLEGQPGPDARAWPWTAIRPTDFVANGDPNAFQLPARTLTVADVEALEVAPFTGGFQGLTLIGPDDGKLYSLSLRPLLPDEAE
jgi:hypothetical protein